ncbi:hypothetical protein Hdeb2414_s0027g00685331 [Helianthus debilis subsp. tardiflorus]
MAGLQRNTNMMFKLREMHGTSYYTWDHKCFNHFSNWKQQSYQSVQGWSCDGILNMGRSQGVCLHFLMVKIMVVESYTRKLAIFMCWLVL